MNASFLILMAVIGELGFMTISILSKRLRNRGVRTLSLLAVYGLTLPLWGGVIAYFFLRGGVTLPMVYVLSVLLWLATCFFLNFGSVFISRFQSLSEGAGYRFGFSILIAILADVVIFRTQFAPALMIVLAVLFAGGILLHFGRERIVGDTSMKLPLVQRLGFILLISLAEVATYALFKYAAGLQESIIFHNALMQALLFSIFLIAGGKGLSRDYRGGTFPTVYIVALVGLMCVAAMADAVAIAGLPVTLFIMFSLIRAACFAVHDIRTGELPMTPATLAAIALIAVGMCSTVFIQEF